MGSAASTQRRALSLVHIMYGSRLLHENPSGLALSPYGKCIYVADRGNDRVAVLNVDGACTGIIGSGTRRCKDACGARVALRMLVLSFVVCKGRGAELGAMSLTLGPWMC